ncbi:hypothetical protein AZE42_03624 [Rhizopogon vesiculosus]|uniref:PH domain-containing protein n=1 Tax=Rhizopogon vesiculosus TaxID=180088 RepID=A0A1J8QTS6_9AGAM|nr:hypothetical protein AZE42_03624 [Rhizopogon vesiculosus]
MSPFHFFSDPPHRSRSPGDSFNQRPSTSTRESKGKQKELVDDADLPYNSIHPTFPASSQSHESSHPPRHLQSSSQPQRTTSVRRPRTSLLSFARKKPSPKPQTSPPLVLSEVIEISRPYSFAHEEQERERLRDAAAQSIGLIEYAASDHHPDHSQEELDPDTRQEPPPVTTHSPPSSPSPPSRSPIPSPIPAFAPPAPPPLPPFPTSLGSLTKQTTLTGTFPKFFPPSSLLVYALAKQWKSRFIILTTALKGPSESSSTVTHLHLFKSNISSSSELHRLPITQDTAIYVTEQSGPSGKRDGKSNSVRGSGGKASGTVVAIEQGSFVWHFEMQDPSERQRWISAIKAVVLGQRSVRAGLTAAPHTLSGHEPRGDMDVMLSMRLQASLSSGAPPPSGTSTSSPRSSASSRSPACPPPVSSALLLADNTHPSVPISKPAIRASPSLEGLRSQHSRSPTLTPPLIPPNTTAKLELLRRKSSRTSPNSIIHRSSGSSSGSGSASSSQMHSIQLHSKRMGNLSAAMLNTNNTPTIVQAQSARSSTSTTKTIRGMFGPRSRSPSLSEGEEGEHAEESFGTVGHSLMGIGVGAPMVGVNISRTASPMGRTDSPVPSVVSSVHDESSGIGSISNGSVYNGATPSVYNSNGNGSINGIPASDLKIVKEDERCSPSPSPSPPTHVSPLPPSPLLHSLQPPPRKKHTIVYPQVDTIFQLTDKDKADDFCAPTSTEDLGTTASTPRAISPVLMPNIARLSVLTTSTTTSGSGVERSGSTTSSTPSHRWSRTLPKRLTPPSGPLPLTPPQLPHESELSLSSSPSSTDSPGAAGWKRTSGSSSVSSVSVRSSPVYPYSVQRANIVGSGSVGMGGGKRRSMPPPRPAPSFAPPPAPEQQPQKTRFRTSIAQRALRLSLTAPRPPPSGLLPPRPDEPTHRRSTSGGSSTDIPTPSPPSRPDSAASSRSISIKQRLRMLSAPSPTTSPVIAAHTDPAFTNANGNGSSSTAHSRSPTPPPLPTPPLPGTPITTMQNHPSFLQLATPVLPTIPPRNPLRQSPPERLLSAPEITSLSPPPRRGSKMLMTQQHLDLPEKAESELPDFSDIRVETGSVVSLGFVAYR